MISSSQDPCLCGSIDALSASPALRISPSCSGVGGYPRAGRTAQRLQGHSGNAGARCYSCKHSRAEMTRDGCSMVAQHAKDFRVQASCVTQAHRFLVIPVANRPPHSLYPQPQLGIRDAESINAHDRAQSYIFHPLVWLRKNPSGS
jgi:hypothetical protein